MAKGKKSKNQSVISKIVMIVIFLVGSLVMFYPFYIDALNNYLDQVRVEQYHKKSQAEYEEQQAKLTAKNKKMAESGISFASDPFDEVASSQISKKEYEKHLIGQINLPKLAVDIPLFDTTTPSFLEAGATVINGTSFPVGGESTHSVISAHRGLPERELFTNLPKLVEGDVFLLTVLGDTLAYEVNTIAVVEPHETSSLKIVEGQDLVTLVTCTPYMINSHRLLVTGHRVPYTPKIKKEVAKGDRFRQLKQIGILAGMGTIILGSVFLLIRVIHLELLRRTRFDLVVQLYPHEGVVGESVQLYNRTGKKPLIREGKPFITTVDASGEVVFSDLPGGIYQIAFEGRKQKIKVGIKKKGQKTKIYSKKYRDKKTNDFSVLVFE